MVPGCIRQTGQGERLPTVSACFDQKRDINIGLVGRARFTFYIRLYIY